MKIVCAGGGSGGHVTPVLAVINELKAKDSRLHVWFVTERGFAPQAKSIMARADTPVKVKLIHAGKVRRYYGVPWWRQLLHLPTTLRNIWDVGLLVLGFVQSLWLLIRLRPDAVFTKGGFVCVPVGLAARCLRIPLVVHDSDTYPGLTNRLLGRYAAYIATGAPLKYYSYPPEKAHYAGIPVSTAYKPATPKAQERLKHKLGYEPHMPLVLITGGGLGAKRVNDAAVAYASALASQAQIVHLTGTKHADAVKQAVGDLPHYHVLAFVDKTMPDLVRAADIVVTRAGATTLLELAATAKPVVIIPHPNLTGGHQLKNAEVYTRAVAAITLQEEELDEQPELLPQTIDWLLQDSEAREQLSTAIARFAKPHAAADVAGLILKAAKKKGQGSARDV